MNGNNLIYRIERNKIFFKKKGALLICGNISCVYLEYYAAGQLEGKIEEEEKNLKKQCSGFPQMMGSLWDAEKLSEPKQDKYSEVSSLMITLLKTKDKDEVIHAAPGLCSAVS